MEAINHVEIHLRYKQWFQKLVKEIKRMDESEDNK